MKVLVTGAGALLGQGIIRTLRTAMPEAQIVAVDPSPNAAGLYWADSGYLVPMAASPVYSQAIRHLLESERPDALLIGTDIELPVYAAQRDVLERDFATSILVSSPEVVAIAGDKWKTFRFLRENGFPHPRSSISLQDREFFNAVDYPLVVKPRSGARSIGVHIVNNAEELRLAFRMLESPIIQELAGPPTEEYTAGAIVFDGECKASIVMRRELKDGNTCRAFIDEYSDLNDEVKALATRLSPHGPVNFQFRMCDNQVKVFEINARFSGTTPLRAHAGFDEVKMCLRYLLCKEEVRQPLIKRLVILRHLEETPLDWNRFEEMSRRLVFDSLHA